MNWALKTAKAFIGNCVKRDWRCGGAARAYIIYENGQGRPLSRCL
jgi:hypothetical protein